MIYKCYCFFYVQVYSKLDASMVNMCVAKAANDEEVLPTGITLFLKNTHL